MSTQITALSEVFSAIIAVEGSASGVLSKVVTEVAGFLEGAATAWEFTNELELVFVGF